MLSLPQSTPRKHARLARPQPRALQRNSAQIVLPRRALLQPESVRTHAAETDDLYVNLLVKGGPAHLSGNIVRPIYVCVCVCVCVYIYTRLLHAGMLGSECSSSVCLCIISEISSAAMQTWHDLQRDDLHKIASVCRST